MARSKAPAPQNLAATVKDIEEMATRIGLQFMRKNVSVLLNLAARETFGPPSSQPKRRRRKGRKKAKARKAKMVARRGPGRPPKPKD